MKFLGLCVFIAIVISILNTVLIYFRQNPSKSILKYIVGIQCKRRNLTGASIGHLCVHQWNYEFNSNCVNNISDLRQLHSFPLHPTTCFSIQQFQWQGVGTSYGQKIIGFIHPPVTSDYTFSLTTDGKAELWISTNKNPSNAARILYHDQSKESAKQQEKHSINHYPSIESQKMKLTAPGKYYIQVLYTMIAPEGLIQLRWKYQFRNKTESSYLPIQGNSISMPDPNNYLLPSTIDKSSSKYLPQKQEPAKQKSIDFASNNDPANYSSRYHTLPFLPRHFLTGALPASTYGNPSYVIASKRFRGRYRQLMQFLLKVPYSIYGKFTVMTQYGDHIIHCNRLLDPGLAHQIANQFMYKLNQHEAEHQYKLLKIVGIEEKIDQQRGKRYLVDLVIQSKVNQRIWRVSEYLFYSSHLQTLCQLSDLQWDPTTNVNIVLMLDHRHYGPTFNLLFTNFIHRLNQYYNSSRDSFFKLYIIDCKIIHPAIKEILKRSLFIRHEIIQLSPYCNYTLLAGLEGVISRIVDLESIVLHYDIKLQLPDDLLDNVRKRSIRRKSFYLPIPFQERCRHNSAAPNGIWKMNQFDAIAYYSSDLLKIINEGNAYSISRAVDHRDSGAIVADFINEPLEQERLCHPKLTYVQV
ncbi:N-acetyl-beta-glucosaminyl-glycoprotein 4-beta-N-acetylgalactosaminyltransferase 1 [Trichoplax sp. H2]|nr:N-acetyl-beta-glucosaminyl-glycoprotein 4-beta-N-acetylgalactosaminyltransferase 1 [Trichoplax sp. H2]|eukprot:RDD45569.1 N-acetyl-beta-glucosaminyl-glycoprotein 4-beta-N-acetylgalactosaminyltransferase 1 [Trichoplax sp. H2]